ncbi:MAG TPA: copper resistance protein CopC [Actinocrinis sp.]|uniref:copper resistance CopC/CopD family protein n=1 Tax=Actinocrinis sp. TaxID=1920516 RepID=UPI002DDC9F10|nr:copper resistance protein CopC [Actinocrinis sp.]HEV2345196.1 copper resistance protein CopC [Actinocrinis sp.]
MLNAFSALVLALLAVIYAAGPAHAHADLVRSDPTAGSIVRREPNQVTLYFSEKVTTRLGTTVRVVGPDGRELAGTHGSSIPAGAGTADALAVPLLQDPAQGTFAIVWHVVAADDGHATEGVVMFSVGRPSPVSAGANAARVADRPDRVVGVIQDAAVWLAFLSYALIVGDLTLRVVARFAGRPPPRGAIPGAPGWLILAAATLTQYLVYGPYISGGSLRQGFSRSLISGTLGTRTGHALGFRIVLLVLLAISGDWLLSWISSARSRIGPTALTAVVAVGLAVTWSATSHAANGSSSTVALAATTLHVVAMGVWLGGLISLLGTLRGEPDASLARAFSNVALAAVALLAATGVYQAWREIGDFDALASTGYGRLLLAKVSTLAVILLVAAKSRTAARREAESHDVRALRRSVILEAVGIAVLLLLTTVLIGTAPPHAAA